MFAHTYIYMHYHHHFKMNGRGALGVVYYRHWPSRKLYIMKEDVRKDGRVA